MNESDIQKKKLWNDNKTSFVWELTLGSHSVTCGESSGSDYQECVSELLALNQG